MTASTKGVGYPEFVAELMPVKQPLLHIGVGLSAKRHQYGITRTPKRIREKLGDVCFYIQAGANYSHWVEPFKSEPVTRYCYRDVKGAIIAFLVAVETDQILGLDSCASLS